MGKTKYRTITYYADSDVVSKTLERTFAGGPGPFFGLCLVLSVFLIFLDPSSGIGLLFMFLILSGIKFLYHYPEVNRIITQLQKNQQIRSQYSGYDSRQSINPDISNNYRRYENNNTFTNNNYLVDKKQSFSNSKDKEMLNFINSRGND